MKKLLLITFSFILLLGCSSVKQTEQALNTGNYDQAINIALKNLRTNKHKKGKQAYVLMLERAFAKVTQRDLDHIKFLKRDGNPAHLEEIYNTYKQLNRRQERIKPTLPLTVYDTGRLAVFNFTDYTNNIVGTKEALADHLYNNARGLMNTTNKLQFRQAFDDFKYLDKIHPNYKNTRALMDEAHFKGTDFVIVGMKNQTQMVIPKRLEEDLLNFGTYGLNDLWTVYHNNRQKQLKYDYSMDINLREINISPEQIRERQILKEKQVPDGKKDLVDQYGNVVKDSLGNTIQVDKFKTIVCEVHEFNQFKSVQVVGKVEYKDLISKQLIDAFPLQSEFVFSHKYATYNGDRNALDNVYIDLIRLRAVPFPSNEQMIFDSGEDMKAKLKAIITRQKFR